MKVRFSGLNDIPDIEAFRQLLQRHGMKATPQRLTVHKAMMSLEHGSADDVESYIGQNLDVKVTTASVYNTLNQLADIGIYSRRSSPDNRTYYDVCSKVHPHLYDTRNGEYVNIEDNGLTDTVEGYFKKRRFKGYSIDRIDIQVLCHPTKKNINK